MTMLCDTIVDGTLRHGPPAAATDSLLRGGNPAKTSTVMIVDDEPINVKIVQKYLRDAGYEKSVSITDSRQALQMIRQERPDVVLLDIMMPHVSGLHILEAVRSDIHLHHLPVLILTAETSAKTRAAALELGATDFLNKPVNPAELIPRVRNALIMKMHYDQQAEYSTRLEREVAERTADLAQSRQELIHVLACAAEYRDHETGNHVLRVGRYAGIIARQLGMNEMRSELIEQAAVLHDVGKIGVPDAILLKPGRLDAHETDVMRRHCNYGASILRGRPSHASIRVPSGRPRELCNSPILKLAATIAMSHHEHWDGTGYPRGLAGEAIPIAGRITAVADVFDALGSRRPYKDPLPLDRCFEILEEGRGTHFDPAVLDAFFSRLDEIVQVAVELSD